MDFEKEEYTPMIDTKKPKPKLGAKAGNTQEFSSLNGVNVKDKAAREDMEELAEYIGTLPPEPWQPLEDGYSNFWFELTDDTRSPWLNFSAKTENAVIDWGDGSGEQALDTLTPTHTYSKAGRYVVKVKGVTGITAMFPFPVTSENTAYVSVLKYVELNNDVTALSGSCFDNCCGLIRIVGNVATVGSSAFRYATLMEKYELTGIYTLPNNLCSYALSLQEINLANVTEIGQSAFYVCRMLAKITIPSTVTTINATAFAYSSSLSEIHVQATVPPTLGTNVFQSIAPNFIIYVPVGTAETYKSASGWSTYADHILEEGQTPNRAMLAKFNSAKESEVKDDELYKDENR